MSAPLLAVQGLARRYGALQALSDVSLTLAAGHVLGLVGPNGAGKTTLLRILATLEFPTGGTVTIDGVDVVDAPEVVRPWVGYMPETFGLYEDLLVWEYLDLFARLLPSGGAGIDAAMELTDLTRLADTPVRVLSRGVRQRLFLARTLLANPRLLVLDEPSAGLDPRARQELGALLRELARMGKAIVLSSHVLSELEGLVDVLAVMERGRLLHCAPVGDDAGRDAFEVSASCVENGDALEALVARQTGVSDVTREDREVRFRFRGSVRELAGLHRALAVDGPPLVSFAVRRPTLEDLYFRVTRGEIQ
jgi:ABC-2 type transport system ATP-binding protein